MRLRPMHPPGRQTRKARGYESDITQLRAQGYTLEAIREALASEGVNVSLSTVWREAWRPQRLPAPAPITHDERCDVAPEEASPIPVAPESQSGAPSLSSPSPSVDPGPALAPLSGKAVAEAFGRSINRDPFLRATLPHRAKDPS